MLILFHGMVYRLSQPQMIMAKVLVGEFVRGDASMLIPPKMGTGERHYDTTTNDDYAPSLIVGDGRGTLAASSSAVSTSNAFEHEQAAPCAVISTL